MLSVDGRRTWPIVLVAVAGAAVLACSSASNGDNGGAQGSGPDAAGDAGDAWSGPGGLEGGGGRDGRASSEGSAGNDAASEASEGLDAANGVDAATGANDASGASDATRTGDAPADGSQLPVLKIMALGDSITRATCWRALLWQQLHQSFPSRFHLVGTLSSDNGCNVPGYETANQGYSSSLVTEVVAGITNARTCDPFCPSLADLMTAFGTVKPDVVLMHYGTNDVWNSKAPSDILNAYSSVIDAVRAANPNVIVLLAQIIPMDVTSSTCSGCSCSSCPTAVPALNAQIATWAPTKSTAASPIVVVDQYTGFDAVADTRDGVHPNNTTGSSKMAAKWYAALMPLF
jgi:lysophospholipase L1-like esterase